MSSEKFVNRHGRRMRVSADEQAVAESQRPAAKPVKPPKTAKAWPRLHLPRIRLGKRTALVLAAVIAVCLAALLVTADGVKRDYERQTATMKRSVATRSQQAISSETSPEKAITNLRKSLSAPTTCNTNGLDIVSWYGPAKSARDDCRKTAATYHKLQTALDNMHAAAMYLHSVNSTLDKALASPADGGYGIISDYADAWTQAADALGSVNPPDGLRAAHTTLRDKTTAVRDAWVALHETNTNQKADEFKAAEQVLTEQYNAFRGAFDSAQGAITSTQTTITTCVRELST